jgi:hypothetical protein
MAQQALAAGGTVARRRALFGLLDANGWSWASLKALFWFTLIIFLMGYLPDRALYFTIFPTIDVGLNVVSPVNLCPASNKDLPCPVPVGATLPWEPAPPELSLPQPRTDGALVQSGTNLLYVGGSTDGTDAVATVYSAPIQSAAGNLSAWVEGTALPEARRHAAVVVVAGTVYVIGGYDASGAPTATTFAGTPDPATGAIAEWKTSEALALPEARAWASVVSAGDGVILAGGQGPSGPTASVWKATLDTKGVLGAWKPLADMPEPRVGAIGSLQGSHLFIYAGSDAAGPTTIVLRGDIGTAAGASASPAASAGAASTAGAGQIVQWGVSRAGSTLPLPRDGAAGFSNSGTLYLVGGTGPDAQGQTYWAIPDASGNISGWKTLAQSNLPADLQLRDSTAIPSGSHVFLVGGTTAQGVTAGLARANLAPKAPYFQLGFFGATIPALGIQGEVGQQLSYLVAAGVATANFVLLILVGVAFAHKERTRALFERYVLRRRPAD